MADSETSETTEASEASETSQKIPKPRRARITRAMKRARKDSGPGFDENEGRVWFGLEEARILAVLDIAAAVRGDQDGDGTETEA